MILSDLIFNNTVWPGRKNNCLKVKKEAAHCDSDDVYGISHLKTWDPTFDS